MKNVIRKRIGVLIDRNADPETDWELWPYADRRELGRLTTSLKALLPERGITVELDDTDIPYIDSIVIGKKVVIFT